MESDWGAAHSHSHTSPNLRRPRRCLITLSLQVYLLPLIRESQQVRGAYLLQDLFSENLLQPRDLHHFTFDLPALGGRRET